MRLLLTLTVALLIGVAKSWGATPVYPLSTNSTAVQTLFGTYTLRGTLSVPTQIGGIYFVAPAATQTAGTTYSVIGVDPVTGLLLPGNFTVNGLGDATARNLTVGGISTFAAPAISSSSSTNGPAANEFAVASWVRGLFNNGVLDYATTNIVAGATNNDTAGQPVYAFSSTIPLSSSRSYVNPAVGTYVGAVMTTNTFTFLQGPIEVNAYMTITTGGGDAIAIHPELYYSYDKTNWYGDFEAQQQSIIGGSTNLYQFVISFPAITATNSSGFYIERRLKVHSKGGSPTLTFLVGTNIASGVANASHISFSGPNSGNGNAYLANDQTFTGANTFNGAVTFNGGASFSVLGVNKLIVTNIIVLTNAATLPVNMSLSESTFQTNASFNLLGFVGLSTTNYQHYILHVWNTLGSTIAITAPANCHTAGTFNVTNLTDIQFDYYPDVVQTNALCLPRY